MPLLLQLPVPNKDLEASELRWPETLKQGSEGTNSKTKRKQNKKNTCLMRVFFSLSLCIFKVYVFLYFIPLVSPSLFLCLCTLSLALVYLVCFFLFFF